MVVKLQNIKSKMHLNTSNGNNYNKLFHFNKIYLNYNKTIVRWFFGFWDSALPAQYIGHAFCLVWWLCSVYWYWYVIKEFLRDQCVGLPIRSSVCSIPAATLLSHAAFHHQMINRFTSRYILQLKYNKI